MNEQMNEWRRKNSGHSCQKRSNGAYSHGELQSSQKKNQVSNKTNWVQKYCDGTYDSMT
jgi:hypothetical protein